MNRKEVKSIAKQALKNDRWLPVGVLLVGGCIGNSLALFFAGVMNYGAVNYFTKSLNGEEKSFKDLFAGFNQYGKLFLTELLMTIYLFLWAFVPVVGIVKMFSYSQTYYVLKDNPELTPNQAITKSREIMNGHKAQLFGLGLSFLGWMIVSAFTLNILDVLYVAPYLQFAKAEFYNRIK